MLHPLGAKPGTSKLQWNFTCTTEMKPLPLLTKNVPTVLREIDSWLVWKLVKSANAKGETVWLKVPYYADGTKRRGITGSEADLSKLVSFRDAIKAYKSGAYAGIGFAPMAEHPITILDLDKCIDENGRYSEFAEEVVESGTYVERSPSGRGLRAVYSGGSICPGEKKNDFLENGERVEIYCGRAFVTITGQRVDDASEQAKKMPAKIKKLLEPIVNSGGSSKPSKPSIEGGLASMDAAPLPEMEADHARIVIAKLPDTWGEPGTGTWYRVAAALHLQFDGSEEAYELLDEWSRDKPGYDPDGNRRRWDAGFSHDNGKEGLTTMRNVVFEAIHNGNLKVKKETMQKWGLARRAEDDFDTDGEENEATLPEYGDLRQMADISNMVDSPADPVEWLVENLIPRASVSFLAGGSGTSKSYLTMQLCAAGAVGHPEFAEMKIVDGGFRSLYFAYEDGRQSLHVRVQETVKWVSGLVNGTIQDILATKDAVDDEDDEDEEVDEAHEKRIRDALRDQMGILPAEVLDSGAFAMAKSKKRFEPMEVTKLLPYLQDYVRANFVDLVVFDTGSEIHTGDENSAADMVVLMRALRLLANSTNCAVLVVQHVQKGVWNLQFDEINQASIRGSSVLVDKSRNVFMLARMPRKDAPRFGLPDEYETHENYVVLKHVKANLGGYVPPKVFARTNRGLLIYQAQNNLDDTRPDALDDEDGGGPGETRRATKNQRDRELILEFVGGCDEDDAPTQNRISAAMMDHMNPATCAMHLTYLVDNGDLTMWRASKKFNAAKHYKINSK